MQNNRPTISFTIFQRRGCLRLAWGCTIGYPNKHRHFLFIIWWICLQCAGNGKIRGLKYSDCTVGSLSIWMSIESCMTLGYWGKYALHIIYLNILSNRGHRQRKAQTTDYILKTSFKIWYIFFMTYWSKTIVECFRWKIEQVWSARIGWVCMHLSVIVWWVKKIEEEERTLCVLNGHKNVQRTLRYQWHAGGIYHFCAAYREMIHFPLPNWRALPPNHIRRNIFLCNYNFALPLSLHSISPPIADSLNWKIRLQS